MVRFYLFKTCVEWDYSEVCSHVLPSGSPLLYPLIMFLDRTAVVEIQEVRVFIRGSAIVPTI
jgi:hypothetical protein